MDRDTKIWKFLLEGNRFYRYSEIKKSFPHLHDAELSKSLRRLEKLGLLVKDVIFHKNRPVNIYLAIDPSNPKIKVRVVTINQLYAVIQRSDEHDVTHIFGINLGELADYIHSVNGELYLEWPKWITCLAEASKVNISERCFRTMDNLG